VLAKQRGSPVADPARLPVTRSDTDNIRACRAEPSGSRGAAIHASSAENEPRNARKSGEAEALTRKDRLLIEGIVRNVKL